MMTWRVELRDEAKEDIEKLSAEVRARILEKLSWLEENFDSITPLPLIKGWRGYFKL